MKSQSIILLVIITMLLSCSKDNISGVNNETNSSSNQKATGSSSNDLLSDKTYKSMILEVVYVEGYKPTTTAINNFKSFLEERTYKPEGIIIEQRSIPSPNKSRYTINDIIDIENTHRTQYNTENKIAVWAFFTDGESDKNTNNGTVLGTAYRNTSFVIYENTLHELSNSTFEPNRSLLETTVITHEVGHLLGLTNLGTTMQNNHEDTEHAKHCNEESCLMYWSAETGDGLSNLFGSNSAPTLDAQCIADLQANGGK
ncbi:membrane metalloprotease [Wenyingzhuangia sp. IMCC45467]